MKPDDIDPIATLASLGISAPTALAPVAGGLDTALWRVEHAGAVYALRVFRPEQAETCRREVLAMRAAAAGGIAVPRIHAEGAWRDRPALLLSWCDGRPLMHALADQPQRAVALGAAFGKMQAAIHATPAQPHQHPDAWIDWAGPDEPALRERLRALALPAGALLHLDYHPMNVMIDGERITCVLDWANLARTVTILRLAPRVLSRERAPMLQLRRAFVAGWRDGYEQAAGPVGDMTLFYAWAGAVMVEDFAQKIGRPGVDLQQRDLDPIRRWAAYWKHRAGIR
jgi:aminoglycoside phosphotransferase (APT) family kinase protein